LQTWSDQAFIIYRVCKLLSFIRSFVLQLQNEKVFATNCFSIWLNSTTRQIYWIITSWRAVSGLSLKTAPDRHAIKSVKVHQRAVMASEAAEAWTHDFAERISKLKAGRQTSLSPAHFLLMFLWIVARCLLHKTPVLLEFLVHAHLAERLQKQYQIFI